MIEEEYVDIRIKKSSLKFLKETAHELNTQDNRWTADPYFCIRYGEKETNMHGEGDHNVLIDTCDGYEEFENEEVARKALIEYGLEEGSELDERIESMTPWSYSYAYRYDPNMFLTEKAIHAHMKSNKHHMKHEAHSYVGHLFRNYEMQSVIAIIKELGGEECQEQKTSVE